MVVFGPMSRTFATTTAAAILLLGIAGIGIITNGATPAGAPDICAGLDSGKIDTTGDPQTVTITAPAGSLITEYCVKAGSGPSGGGPVYVPVDPPAASVTFGHPTGKAVSHYSYAYESTVETTVATTIPEPTTTPVVTTTTLPESTTTLPEPTTTLPESTTTLPEPTTTVPPVATSEPGQTTTTSTTTTSTTTTSVQSTSTTTPVTLPVSL